jgi:penicillin-binding protein 2
MLITYPTIPPLLLSYFMTLMQSSSFPPQSRDRTVGNKFRFILLTIVISLLMLGPLGSRLAYLQLIQGKAYRTQADYNRIRGIPKQPVRGNIFDRNGKLLATSRLSHTVFIWPMALASEEWPNTLKRLSALIELPESELLDRLEKTGYDSPLPVRIARTITPEQATALEEYSAELPGVEVGVEAVRHYPHGNVAAHALGYTGEIDYLDLEVLKERGYRLGDAIGQMGVEMAFEDQLRGEWGGQQVEVDSSGKILKLLGETSAQSGQDVQLTLDLELQKAAERVLGYFQGAIVAIDPQNGAVLAMASRPTFDPNIFSTRISDEQWSALQSEDHPFVNRALRGFPPASTFKIVTATAAMESGEFSPYTVLPTYPYVTVAGLRFWDWNRAGFGPLGFVGALAWSSDTFFYQVALQLGGKRLIEWTRKYGFGRPTGIEIAAEEDAGQVPDPQWKLREIGEQWVVGDTVNMSIGQGYLLATPLQVAMMFAVPANGGYRVKPHLLADNREASAWRESLQMKPETIDVLQAGLQQVVYGGTGKALNVSTLPPNAGKTGTAEAPPRASHAWYGGYAPLNDPEIVVVAFAEHSGGGGGSVTAPMVRQVLEAYFKQKSGK